MEKTLDVTVNFAERYLFYKEFQMRGPVLLKF